MHDVKLFRYYVRLLPFGAKAACSVTLSEVADKLSASLRHARNLLKEMQGQQWLSWQPSVGRNQRSVLTLNLTKAELQQLIAMQYVEQGFYDKALDMLGGDQQWFGSLLKDTSGASQRSGELHLQLTYYRPFKRIVPHNPQRNSERFLLRQLYSCLVKCTSSGVIEADLAHTWRSEQEGRYWKFYLRPGLTFHDGQPITAHTIATLFELLKTHPCYERELAHLTTVTALREQTLVFELSQPDLGFSGLLADPKYSIQPAEQLSSTYLNIVGSGPFQIVSHTQDKLHMQAFPHYYACRALTDEVTIWHVPHLDSHKRFIQDPSEEQVSEVSPELPSCRQYLERMEDDEQVTQPRATDVLLTDRKLDAVSYSDTQPILLEHGCMYAVFNQRASKLTAMQRDWLRAFLDPKALLAAIGTSEDEQGLQAATNLLPIWTPVLKPGIGAKGHVDLKPNKITIAYYSQSELINAVKGMISLLTDNGVEVEANLYLYDEMQSLIDSEALSEDLILASTSLDDNRPASAFRWFYGDSLLHNALPMQEQQWLDEQLIAIRQTRQLPEYLAAIEPLATAMVNASWVAPLYHYKQMLRFQDVLKGVAITNWGWPEIKDIWIED